MPSVSDYKAPFSVWTVWAVPLSGRPTPENDECAHIWMSDSVHDAAMMATMLREQFMYAHMLGLRRRRKCAQSFFVADDNGHVIENDRFPHHVDMMPAHPVAAARDGARGFYEFDDIQRAAARRRIVDRVHATFRPTAACGLACLRLLEELDCTQPAAAAAAAPAASQPSDDKETKVHHVCDDLEEALSRVKRARAAVASNDENSEPCPDEKAVSLAGRVESEVRALIDTFRGGDNNE